MADAETRANSLIAAAAAKANDLIAPSVAQAEVLSAKVAGLKDEVAKLESLRSQMVLEANAAEEKLAKVQAQISKMAEV